MGKKTCIGNSKNSVVEQIHKEILENELYYEPWVPTYYWDMKAILIGCN